MNAGSEYVVEVLKGLVEIRTENPPGNEKMLAEYIALLLQRIGIDTSVIDVSECRANVIGVLNGKGESPVLVMNGHLDTVPVKEGWSYPPHAATIAGQRMYGLGTADMKGGVAAMIAAVKSLKESKRRLKGTLILSFVADEERKNAGTIHFLKSCKNIDYAVIGEPTELNIAISNRGVMRFRISTRGTAGHASNPSQGTNAIYVMNSVVSELMGLAQRCSTDGNDYSNSPSLSVTMIRGGTAENIIPDLCEIIIDRRIVYRETMSGVQGELEDLMKKIERSGAGFAISLEPITKVNAWKIGEESQLLRHGIETYRRCFHRDPELKAFGATCEAPLFAERGIDTLIFGPGSIKNAHAKDEYVEVGQLIKAAEYFSMLIESMLVA